MDLVIGALTSRYAQFSGRARRKEYWLFILFFLVLYAIAFAIEFAIGTFDSEGIPFVVIVVVLALIVPGVAIVVRRLHDTDRSGWWWFIQLVPLVGPIALLVFMCLPGTPGPNRFGADPLA